MKAKKLRTGNFVMYNNIIGEVQNICTFDEPEVVELMFDEETSGVYDIDNIKPVPITRNALNNFGWKTLSLNSFTKNGLEFFIEQGIVDNGDSEVNKYKIKYIHQLQNLYFALTNKEMKIKISNIW